MGAVIPFLPADAVDRAWYEYQEYAARAVATPNLLIDRDFFNEMTRREARYKKLLIAQERMG